MDLSSNRSVIENCDKQNLEELGLAVSDDESSEQNHLSINELNFPLQYHLKAENGKISYRIVDITNPQKTFIVEDNFQKSQLSSLIDEKKLVQQEQFKELDDLFLSAVKKQKMSSQSNSLKRRSTSNQSDNKKNNKDDKKIKHNEIERKRRDKINNWIGKLSKIVPECLDDTTKQSQSKGVILSKACDYIASLKKANLKLNDVLDDNANLKKELAVIKKENYELLAEIESLKNLLEENGITLKD